MDNITRVQCFGLTALALTTTCVQYASLLMAQAIEKASEMPPKRIKWQENEIEAMIDYLYEHQAEAGEGGFKLMTFNCVAEHIAPLLIEGGRRKEAKHCRSKFTTVCCFS